MHLVRWWVGCWRQAYVQNHLLLGLDSSLDCWCLGRHMSPVHPSSSVTPRTKSSGNSSTWSVIVGFGFNQLLLIISFLLNSEDKNAILQLMTYAFTPRWVDRRCRQRGFHLAWDTAIQVFERGWGTPVAVRNGPCDMFQQVLTAGPLKMALRVLYILRRGKGVFINSERMKGMIRQL